MSLTGIPSKDDLSALIKQASIEAQASGGALEDHLAALLHDLMHQSLTEATSDVAGALAPVLAELERLRSESALWRAESVGFRTTIRQIFNLPPEQPK